MAEKRDYYEVLGLDRSAGEDAVKKAFRRRARELHPDVNPSPEAEAQFKEAAEAYEVLSDPERRRAYDAYGHAGLRGAAGGGGATDFSDFGSFQDLFDAFFGGDMFGRGTRRAAQGQDAAVQTEISFVESATGAERTVTFDAIAACEQCDGSGNAPGSVLTRCPTCAGQGQVRQVTRGPFGQFVRAAVCPDCAGRGEVPSQPCPACQGAGRRAETREITISIPAGIAPGQQVRLVGRGHAGQAGAPAGDLYVHVEVTPDERFRRDGLDVVTRVPIPVTDAMMGGTITVPTVDGEAPVDVPAGTQSGEHVVLRGKGFPALQGRGHGDQRVVLDVRVPKAVNGEARAAVERLAEALDEKAYSEDEGFFGRLKNAFR